MCSEASLCTAWDGSVSSSRLLNPPVDIWCLEDEWFYTSHSIRKQNLLESCITGFTRISSFSESTCSFCPQQLPFEFPHLQLPLYHADAGAQGTFCQGIGFLGYGLGWVEPFCWPWGQSAQESTFSMLWSSSKSVRIWILSLSQKFFHLNRVIHFSPTAPFPERMKLEALVAKFSSCWRTGPLASSLFVSQCFS